MGELFQGHDGWKQTTIPHDSLLFLPVWQLVRSDSSGTMSVCSAMTDGASARVSAIHAALREYRPSLLHMAELKRFFSSGRISFGDVEFHEFETWQTRPVRHPELKLKMPA